MTAWQRLRIEATYLRHVSCAVLFHSAMTNYCNCLTFLGPLLLTSLPITSQMCSKGLRSGERDRYGRTFACKKRHSSAGRMTGRNILHQALTPVSQITMCVCVCIRFNVAFNNFSVILRRCLVVTGSSMLTFIVLPH